MLAAVGTLAVALAVLGFVAMRQPRSQRTPRKALPSAPNAAASVVVAPRAPEWTPMSFASLSSVGRGTADELDAVHRQPASAALGPWGFGAGRTMPSSLLDAGGGSVDNLYHLAGRSNALPGVGRRAAPGALQNGGSYLLPLTGETLMGIRPGAVSAPPVLSPKYYDIVDDRATPLAEPTDSPPRDVGVLGLPTPRPVPGALRAAKRRSAQNVLSGKVQGGDEPAYDARTLAALDGFGPGFDYRF